MHVLWVLDYQGLEPNMVATDMDDRLLRGWTSGAP